MFSSWFSPVGRSSVDRRCSMCQLCQKRGVVYTPPRDRVMRKSLVAQTHNRPLSRRKDLFVLCARLCFVTENSDSLIKYFTLVVRCCCTCSERPGHVRGRIGLNALPVLMTTAQPVTIPQNSIPFSYPLNHSSYLLTKLLCRNFVNYMKREGFVQLSFY